MATIEVIRDQKPVDLAPIDPNVSIPESVRRAAEIAESFYKPVDTPAPATPPVGEDPPKTPEPAPSVVVEPPTQITQPAPVEPLAPQFVHDPNVSEDSWESRYHSMKGRFDASQRTIGHLQQQMTDLGDELMRTQALMNANQQPQGQNTPPANHNKLITQEDVENYGEDLIGLARRVAAETLGPEIEQLRNENNQLKHSMTTTAQQDVNTTLDSRVPEWRAINKSPAFKAWLRQRDIYSGEVRHSMLNAAYQAANAPRVLAFFEGFLNEAQQTTGQTAPAPATPAPPPAPREPAVPLASLAAPGRARPASGGAPTGSSADKPVFTRAQISAFYADVRRGAYAGNEVEKNRIEQQIFSAQNEGRIR